MSNCSMCKKNINPRRMICDHCDHQNDPPNVRLAKNSTEVAELDAKYQSVLKLLNGKQAAAVGVVENCIKGMQTIAIARSAVEIANFLERPDRLYQTYHQQVFSNGRYAGTGPIDEIRLQFENAALPNLADKTVFGSMSVANKGQPDFGNTTMILNPSLCKSRTSFFWGNPYVMSKQMKIVLTEKFPEGYRATWQNAYKLVTCKHHTDIGDDSLSSEKCHEMVNRSSFDGDPDYIEAHHWEGFPASKIAKIVFSPDKSTSRKDKIAWELVKCQVDSMHPHIKCEEA